MRLIHSYSALSLFEQCGLSYYRQRIIKDVPKPTSEYITHGDNVHKAIENKLKRGIAVPKELGMYAGVINSVETAVATTHKTLEIEKKHRTG